MNLRKTVLLLAAAATGVLAAGCATHTANGKSHTVVLGGLVDVQDGAYDKQPASTLALNTDAPLPGSELTGNKVSILWGLFSFRDQ